MKEATKLNAETGDPPARIPEITESSHSDITFTQALEGNNDDESCEKLIKGETGGET